MKKKILIFNAGVQITNFFFIQNHAFQELAETYDIDICCNVGLIGSDLDLFRNRGFKKIYSWTWSARRRHIWAFQLHINTLGGRKLSSTSDAVYCMLGRAYGNVIARFIYRILGFSYHLAKAANYIFEKYVGEDKNIKNIIKAAKPDLIITFLGGSLFLEIESIKAAKINKIPVMGIQYGWEHLTARGQMPYLPDYMGVWGYQSRIFAERIQKMPPERIFHVGSPFGDTFKTPSDKPRSEIRRKLGLPEGKKVLFFVGSGAGYNEVRTLRRLDKAIEEGKLGNSCIFYRPHPFQHIPKNDLNFFAQDFKHVYLDPALAEMYKSAIKDNRGFLKSKNCTPVDFEYVNEILTITSIIVVTSSTVILQAAIHGIPSVVMFYTDTSNKKFMKVHAAEESSLLKGMPGIFICISPDALIPTCLNALRFYEDKPKSNLMKQYAILGVHDDELGFKGRVRSAIDAVLNPQELSAFHFLNSPILAKNENQIIYE